MHLITFLVNCTEPDFGGYQVLKVFLWQGISKIPAATRVQHDQHDVIGYHRAPVICFVFVLVM